MDTTHIQSLTHNTPKARRRVRKTLGLEKGVAVSTANVASAVTKAFAAERAHNPQKGKKR